MAKTIGLIMSPTYYNRIRQVLVNVPYGEEDTILLPPWLRVAYDYYTKDIHAERYIHFVPLKMLEVPMVAGTIEAFAAYGKRVRQAMSIHCDVLYCFEFAEAQTKLLFDTYVKEFVLRDKSVKYFDANYRRTVA